MNNLYLHRVSNLISWPSFFISLTYLVLLTVSLVFNSIQVTPSSLGLKWNQVMIINKVDLREAPELETKFGASAGDFIIESEGKLVKQNPIYRFYDDSGLERFATNLWSVWIFFVPISILTYIFNYIAFGRARFLPWKRY